MTQKHTGVFQNEGTQNPLVSTKLHHLHWDFVGPSFSNIA